MIIVGDCLSVLRGCASDTFDCVCTDPPYGLEFMGKSWDGCVPGVEVWREVLRVAKPGAWLTAFGGTRTYHRLACAIEDAGWEIRDCLMWMYGTGFPKSHDVGKAIDKAAGAERRIVGVKPGHEGRTPQLHRMGEGWDQPWMSDPEAVARYRSATAPATELARVWDGYGTALKPAYEPILLARKPLTGPMARHVEAWGTGGLHVEACRVPVEGGGRPLRFNPPGGGAVTCYGDGLTGSRAAGETAETRGRWPPNVLLSHGAECVEGGECGGDCPVALCPAARSAGSNLQNADRHKEREGIGFSAKLLPGVQYEDTGSAARFFPRFHYTAKAAKKERAGSSHPTVKPLAVIEWLLRLTLPPLDRPEGAPRVLDPFMGSGTAVIAADRLGALAVGVELSPTYAGQALARCEALGVERTLIAVAHEPEDLAELPAVAAG